MRVPPRNYQEYLASAEWKQRRDRVLYLAQHRCQSPICLQAWARSLTDAELHASHRYRLEVHHLTYARLGCEEPDDLIVLCAACHAREHGIAHVDEPLSQSIGSALDGALRRLADRSAA